MFLPAIKIVYRLFDASYPHTPWSNLMYCVKTRPDGTRSSSPTKRCRVVGPTYWPSPASRNSEWILGSSQREYSRNTARSHSVVRWLADTIRHLVSAQSVVSGDETALAGLDLDDYSRLVWISHVTADNSLASWLCGTDAPYPARYEGIKLVSADFPPTCVVAASADTLIPPIQSHNLAQAVRACGVEAVLFECEGMIHGQAEALASSPPWPENNGWWESAIRPSLDFAIRKMTEV